MVRFFYFSQKNMFTVYQFPLFVKRKVSFV